TVHLIKDARGATRTMTYNARHKPTAVSYYASSGVASTPNVSFSYDAAGNTHAMTDGLGTVTYTYDQLSRLTSELRHFTGLASTSTGGDYTLNYGYNLAGAVTS